MPPFESCRTDDIAFLFDFPWRVSYSFRKVGRLLGDKRLGKTDDCLVVTPGTCHFMCVETTPVSASGRPDLCVSAFDHISGVRCSAAAIGDLDKERPVSVKDICALNFAQRLNQALLHAP